MLFYIPILVITTHHVGIQKTIYPLLCLSEYPDALMDLLFGEVLADPEPYRKQMLQIPVPDNLNAQYDKPVKADAIAAYVSRFSHQSSLSDLTQLGTSQSVHCKSIDSISDNRSASLGALSPFILV